MTPPPFPRIAYRRGDAEIRHRQARSAQPAGHRRRQRDLPRLAASASSPSRDRRAAASCARSRRPAPPTRPRSFFDKLNEWAQRAGRAGARLHHLRPTGGGKGPDRQEPRRRRGSRQLARADGARRRRCRVLRLRQEGRGREVRRRGAHASSASELGLIDEERVPLLLDRRLPDVRAQRGDRQDRVQPQPVLDAAGRARGAGDQGPADDQGLSSTTSSATASSCRRGAIRNHLPEIMYKAFAIAGYRPDEVEARFGGMLNAFKFGAPPHGGSAPGHRPHRHAAGRRAATSARSSPSR